MNGLRIVVSLLLAVVLMLTMLLAFQVWQIKKTPPPPMALPRSSLVIPANGAWNFIVPNQYIGDLAIAFNCPGGHPLTLRSGVITTRFSATRPVCVSDIKAPDVDPWQIHAWWANGTPLASYSSGASILAGQTVFAPRLNIGQRNPTLPNWFFTVYYVGPSDCARDSFSSQFQDHMPARCHYVDPFTFTKPYAG